MKVEILMQSFAGALIKKPYRRRTAFSKARAEDADF